MQRSKCQCDVYSDKVTLRPVEERDLQLLYSWMQDPELLRSINRTEKTIWSSHIEWYKRMLQDESQIVFSIEEKQGGTLIGQCGLRRIDYKSQKAELWIFIGEHEVRGQGFGCDAVKKLLRYAFEEKRLNRVYLYVVDFNEGAKLFYEKLGFRQEGIFRQDIFIDGGFHDTIHMAILKEQYVKDCVNG